MATLITRVNAGINFITDLVGYTIRINYVLGEALFTLLSWALGHVTTGTRTLLAVLKVAIFDLGQFVEDLGGYVTIGVTVVDTVINLSCQLVSTLFFAFLSALASFVSVVIGIGSSAYVTLSSLLDVLRHLVEAGGKSLVLILHTIPLSLGNGAKRTLRSVITGWLTTKEAIKTTLCDINEIISEQQRNLRKLFQGLPGEAYFGFLLFFLLLLVAHCTIRTFYTNRVNLLNRVYQLATKVSSAFRSGVVASFSLSWLQASPNTSHSVLERGSATEDVDSSTSSSFDSLSPYNLRQRKPGQRSVRSSRIESIKRQLQMEKESRLCVICSDRRRSVVLLPCRHFSFCEPCINQSARYYDHCPVCRTNIEEVVPVYQ